MTIDGSPIDSSAKMLEDAALAPYPIYAVPNATRELRLMVNQSAPTVWVLEMGHAFKSNNGQQTPLLFAPRNASGVFSLERGEVVDVLLQVRCWSPRSVKLPPILELFFDHIDL
jgi:hypothetical protein